MAGGVYNVHRYPPGGLYIYSIGKNIIPPIGIPRNIVGIFNPEIWSPGGLQGYLGFSGIAICVYIPTPLAPCVPPENFKSFSQKYKYQYPKI